MRKWFVMLCLLAAALLPVACAPAGGQEPAVVVEPTIDAPALNPVPLPAETDPEVNAAEAAPAGDAAGNTASDETLAAPPATTRPSSAEPVSPGEVALGDLTPTTPSAPRREAPAPGRPAADSPAGRERVMVVTAVLDMIDRLGVPAESVAVESIEAITWPDASLGCPQPGVDYAQVAIAGSRITLRAGDETFTYHTDGDSRYILCQDGEVVDEGVAPGR
ncbi:MAG TPA: hypothetical protein PLH39_08505 [Promineifilum sp.]|nr:hypothetical protein [Promineifilum sp.]